jgi:ankyrin repeat protein
MPLHFAVLAKQTDNVRILCRYGANPNASDALGNTALHYAVAGRNLRLVKILEEYGSDGTQLNIDEVSPIDMSITEDIKDIKMHFMSLPKYKNFDFAGNNQQTQQ